MKSQIIPLIIIITFLFAINLIPIQGRDVLKIPNFDVRENFRDCFNNGYSSEYQEITCATNWPIQFSLLLTDKNCILNGKKDKRLISSMNINSCMKITDKINNCRELSKFYSSRDSTEQVISDTIKFFNTNGAQYEDENLYKLLRDSEDEPGYFPECSQFTPSVSFKVDTIIEYWNDSVSADFAHIKRLIYEEGPILAMIDTNKNDIEYVDHAIYLPEPVSTLKHDGLKFLRVVGWRTLQGNLYWIFSYTQGETWGLNNYKLIPQGTSGLTFLEIKILKEKENSVKEINN